MDHDQSIWLRKKTSERKKVKKDSKTKGFLLVSGGNFSTWILLP